MKTVKIKDHDDLVRDVATSAVLNTDVSALEKYRARRDKQMEVFNDVQTLKNEMSEIKQLLQQLVNRDNK